MEIVCLDPYLTSYMETKSIIYRLEKFVWIIFPIKNNSFKILLVKILKNTFNKEGKVVYGVMMLRFKQFLKFILDLSKYMFLITSLLELFMKIINKKFNLLDLLMLVAVIMIL
jgi:hypothetical protein